MSMIAISSLRRRAVGDGNGQPLPDFDLRDAMQPVDPRLHVIRPDAGEAVREGQHDGDEQRAQTEQPKLREGS